MTSARRYLRIALGAALALAACAPPGDVRKPGDEQPARPRPPATRGADAANPDAPDPTDPAPAPQGGDGTAALPGEAPAGAEVTSTPRRIVYEKLAGGVYTPRCPACGEVQPEASTQCRGCGQNLVPWRQEWLCAACGGEGRCDRCGDDRPCTDCDGNGVCPFCKGSGKQGGVACPECGGGGRCPVCQADGFRESVKHDFLPHESWLPGVCPTCVDGSGLCPECGTSGRDAAGGTCLSCSGYGLCHDCGGTGHCAHDGGDGTCPVCAGAGREVRGGEPRRASDRVVNLRTAAGSVVTGRIVSRPDPNVHLGVAEGGRDSLQALLRSQLHPLSYFVAHLAFVAPDDGKGHMDLATIALTSGYWPLAQRELQRAMAADAGLTSQAAAQLRDVESRRILDWVKEAEASLKAGDRDRAVQLLQMVRFKAQGTPQAIRAEALLLQVKRDREVEEEGLDDAARQRAAAESEQRVARAVVAARARLVRARALLTEAQAGGLPDPGVERLLSRADAAATGAQRMVLREAWRRPAASAPWPDKPQTLASEARLLRAEVAVARAVRAVAGGRFEIGARFARRASYFDASNQKAPGVLDAAELGMVRRGVLTGSPPPDK